MTFSIEEGNPPWADTSDANELPAGGRVGEESPTALLAFAAVNVKEGCSN